MARPDDFPPKTVSSSVKRNLRAYAPFIANLLAIGWTCHWPFARRTDTGDHARWCYYRHCDSGSRDRATGLQRGIKHAGVIIFDICGAGALAGVILASGFSETALGQITSIIPVLLVPFVLASLIQTAQGSRVVTTVLSAGILAGTYVNEVIHPVALIIMIAAGCFVFSFVTDPFFWIVSRTTGDDFAQVIRRYTIPLALCGWPSISLPLNSGW